MALSANHSFCLAKLSYKRTIIVPGFRLTVSGRHVKVLTMCVCVCVCVCMRGCLCACVHVCVLYKCVCIYYDSVRETC